MLAGYVFCIEKTKKYNILVLPVIYTQKQETGVYRAEKTDTLTLLFQISRLKNDLRSGIHIFSFTVV